VYVYKAATWLSCQCLKCKARLKGACKGSKTGWKAAKSTAKSHWWSRVQNATLQFAKLKTWRLEVLTWPARLQSNKLAAKLIYPLLSILELLGLPENAPFPLTPFQLTPFRPFPLHARHVIGTSACKMATLWRWRRVSMGCLQLFACAARH